MNKVMIKREAVRLWYYCCCKCSKQPNCCVKEFQSIFKHVSRFNGRGFEERFKCYHEPNSTAS